MSSKPVTVADLSIEELKNLIQDTVREVLRENNEDLASEPRFQPQIAERLRRFRAGESKTLAADEVAQELGFDVG